MVGIIVAPKGHVFQAAGNLNGQIIANIAGNNGEVHQVTRRTEEIELLTLLGSSGAILIGTIFKKKK